MVPRPARGSKRHKKTINGFIDRPWTLRARSSRQFRKYLDSHAYVTPHFSWAEMGSNRGDPVPLALRSNAIRHGWNLERFRHALGDVAISIDGPYRTVEYNREIGGAPESRHTYADASDHFLAQVNEWVAVSKKLTSRNDVINIANRVFARGGVGNETSGTLHVDSRGYKARFITWTAAS